jgi:PAS domain S-box-containing protein/putative nucleotidyltransferase with HDIG domain
MRFEYVSPSVERLRGYTVEEVMAQPVVDTMIPASRATVMGRLSARMAAFEAGDPFAVSQVDEVEQTRKDGSTVWTDVTTTFIKGDDGLTRVVGVSRDISQRKKAAEALRESEERFRSMAEQMVDVLFVTATDGVIRYISPSSASIFGWQPEEMIGQNFTRYLIDADIPRAMRGFRTDVEQGKPSRHLELTMKRKDGSTFLGELNAAARWKNGRAVDVLGLIRDITERKQAEQSLRQSETRYRAIVEDQTELIIRWLPDTTLTFVNEAFCRFISRPREQLLGQRFLPNISPEDREPTEKRVALLSENNVGQDSEQRIRLTNGEVRWVQWTDRVFTDEAGRVVEIQSVGRDITERKQMDVELQVRTNELEALFALSSALNIAQTESAMLTAILAEVNRALGADASGLALYDPDRAEFRVAQASGELATNVGRTFSALEGLDVQRLMNGRPYIVEEFGKVEDRTGVITGMENLGPAVFAPVQSQEQFLGIMAAMRRKGAPNYDASTIRLLAAGGEMVGNALHRVRLHDQALVRLQHLQILQRIGSAISNSFDLAHILPLLATEITAQTRVDATAIFLLNSYTLQLDYAAGHGFKSGAIKKAHFRLGGSLAGTAALERRIIAITNDLADQVAGNAQFAEFVKAESFVSYSAVPLVTKGKVKGVLEFFSRSQLPSDAEWLDFMKTLAHQAAIAMDNVELFDGLQRSNLELALAYDATIEGWSRAMDLRDRDTEGHSLRVTEITERLARALGMGEAEIVNIRRGALLHDIGKMGVPDSILHKPGKLTDEEWVLMRKHPQYAHDMLWPIPYLRPALDIPYCHHEKWDGNGYPRGLKGETIPLAARIFAVVDVWDALISDRPYRAAWPAERVREYIRGETGKQFDPRVVEAFFRLNLGRAGMNEGVLPK